ncbi:TIGR01620 family protein [Histophilus somni]|uniref:TIGR01620 family protein n=1 Tax=Histophilus somni TaxID=731 RepID=UPI00201E8982|nr:TIGR01620 family protein [Histophilus somni]
MPKKVFQQEDVEQKITENFEPKQEFEQDELDIEMDCSQSETTMDRQNTDIHFQHMVRPKLTMWQKLLMATICLFSCGILAQSVQWLVDSWRDNQWIAFVFAMVSLFLVLLGLGTIIKEWRRLVQLKKRLILQEKSREIRSKSAVNLTEVSSEGKELCLKIASLMGIDDKSPQLIAWQEQVHEAYTEQEILRLFSQNVLIPFDRVAKKLISKNAVESALIVAVSPLAIVDMFFIAWRNIRLINQLAKLYGIELGYVSRLRLLRMVFVNMAFAGATDVIQDLGLEWLSQDITAKLSARVAQGIGVGILTARLGIKAMEFCRPIAVAPEEKLRLSHIQTELLGTLKTTLFSANKVKEKVR